MSTRPEPSSPSAPTAPTAPAPPSDALVGKRVNKYEVVRVIGRGGMGTVYEALNTTIGKRVAMKFIDADTVQNADAVARFQREAQAASAVESAHIVDIFDSGISETGQPYIVMELLRGEDLGHRIKRHGRLELAEAVHVTAQLLRGLHRAHKAGIVHRDLKPDNVFLVDRDDDPNFAKILDFGISKVRRRGETPVNTLTRQGTVLGTPFYMSPEQAQAQPDVDARSDLWSVGAILYECLSGRPPYTGATYEQVIVNICMNDAEDVRTYNPGVPEPVAHVIARALARDREDRFEDAREFLDALRAATGGLVSSRGGSLADDFNGSSSSDSGRLGVASSTTPSGRKRAPQVSDPALDATVKFHSTPPAGDRRPGLSGAARRRAMVARQRRLIVLVALSALVLGGLVAFGIARFVVRPPRATVPVQPAEAAHEPPPTAPPASTSVVAPAPEPPPTVHSAEAAPTPADSADAKTHAAKTVHTVVPPSTTSSVKVTPKPPETAAPVTSGVAPGLKLRPY